MTEKGDGVFRLVRPSRTEQGIEQGNWEAAYLVLVPAAFVDGSLAGKSPFSENIAGALRACAPDLGAFPSYAAWIARPELANQTGKVRIQGNPFYQYVTHRLSWRVVVSDTGRGYRLARLHTQAFGAIRGVPIGAALRTTVAVGYEAVDRNEADKPLSVTVPLALDSIEARCDGSRLTLFGVTAVATDGGWREGILRQPYNAVVDIIEEVSP